MHKLEAQQLYRHCDKSALTFETTAELTDVEYAIGQERALAALDFAVQMDGDGYNLFVLGPSGSHKHQMVEDFLERASREREAARDWCYLNNFVEPRKPLAIRLAAGRATDLRDDMVKLVAELKEVIPATFESEQYRNRIAEINQEFEDRHRAALEQLQNEARERGMSVMPTPQGLAIAPLRDGKILADEEFDRLPEAEKETTRAAIEYLSEKLRKHFQEIPNWQKEHREQIRKLNREVTDLAAGRLIDQLESKYKDCPELDSYFHSVREDVLENARDFLSTDSRESPLPFLQPKKNLSRYEVNVVVSRGPDERAPVIYENYPSVQNLLGRIEHLSQFGALMTDFTMIRPGALHRANGGYLIMDAARVLTEPYAWSSLKRALFAREIRVESLGQLLSLISTESLEPEPIPLDLKVVLIGDRRVYYALCELDPDFVQLFKVPADFEDQIDRSTENTALYARLIATLARRDKLRPVSRDAVARIIEQSARLVGDSEKLTTRLRKISDLLQEADHWAHRIDSAVVNLDHVEKAISAQTHRVDRIRAQLHEQIQRHNILIDTDDAVVGQINGLSVLNIGNFSFGQPSRITATVRIGEGKIVDIERETELGGPIHSKGVLILSSYLASRYAAKSPLSLAASLVFEQSYGSVEGDSASVAETCVLLSALAEIPIDQSLAVTGSINQHGQVQAIGGVNEKVEGFYDICKQRGLTGKQGVLIPQDNVKHLMLRADVVASVAAEEFKIISIAHVDEALSLLTGTEAGTRDQEGNFPDGSVNALVEASLLELAEVRRSFVKSDGDPSGKLS